jgi:hypothetical protein
MRLTRPTQSQTRITSHTFKTLSHTTQLIPALVHTLTEFTATRILASLLSLQFFLVNYLVIIECRSTTARKRKIKRRIMKVGTVEVAKAKGAARPPLRKTARS